VAEDFLDVGGIIVTPEMLAISRARETASVLSRGVLEYATLLECRRRDDGKEEILLIEVGVQTPQLKAYDIRPKERVALVFRSDDGRPDVLSLRPDFPQPPHLNLTQTEYPKSLCLYEEDWLEVKSSWTPARFVERVRYWFAETVKGTLHKDDQPLEPLILGSGYQVVVPYDLFTMKGTGDVQRLFVSMQEESSRVLIARRPERPSGFPHQGVPFVAVALRAEPQKHGIIKNAPANIFELHQFLSAAGLDLLGKLRSIESLWGDKSHLKAKLLLVVACPKTRGSKTSIESTDVWSFVIFKTVAEVLSAIGRRASGGGLILGEPGKDEQGQSIPLQVCRTVYGFSDEMAAYLNGYEDEKKPKTVAIGLGALGSKVQLGLSRTGFGKWTLVDEDVLLPHNLARHQYTGFWLGCNKSDAAAVNTHSLFDDEEPPTSIPANVLSPGEQEDALKKAFAEAEIILDMSASVPVARHLALKVESKARRVSVFLNPAGTDLVILAEDVKRKTSLDALEFQLYRAVLSDPRLKKHLTDSTGRVRYSASCRDITSRVPDGQVSLLAAIASRAIPLMLEKKEAQISIWQLDKETLGVNSFTLDVAKVQVEDYSGWSLVVDSGLKDKLQSLRKAKLPNETGGVLLGAFDHLHHRAYVVDTIPSPPDSEEWPTLYIRGSAMLAEEVERVQNGTAGNLEYIGEWHSHPKGFSCQPSNDDLKVFAWLTKHMDEEGQPALMSIVGDKGPWFFLGQMLWKGG
jgi:integrative and conjugative element protein (TIGR02256 family)